MTPVEQQNQQEVLETSKLTDANDIWIDEAIETTEKSFEETLNTFNDFVKNNEFNWKNIKITPWDKSISFELNDNTDVKIFTNYDNDKIVIETLTWRSRHESWLLLWQQKNAIFIQKEWRTDDAYWVGNGHRDNEWIKKVNNLLDVANKKYLDEKNNIN